MSNDEKEILKEKIKRAIKISSQKLIEKKRALGQKLVISEDGKISVIEPWKKRAAAIYLSIKPFKVNFVYHDKPVLTYWIQTPQRI